MTTSHAVRLSLSLLLASLALPACGAKVDSYEPSLAGIDNEGVDPNGPPQDVSFIDGDFISRVDNSTCGGPYSMVIVDVIVANEYRFRKVKLRYVDGTCTAREGIEVTPGEQAQAVVMSGEIIRVYDAADDTLLSAWKVTLNALGTDRIVLRSSSPDI